MSSRNRLSDSYTDLAIWKDLGFKQFPPYPIYGRFGNRMISQRKRKVGLLYDPEEKCEFNAEMFMVFGGREVQERQKMVEAYEELKRTLDNEVQREKALREFARKTLGTKQGGRAFTQEELKILKWYYGNMQECIKYIRKKCDINAADYQDWGEDNSEPDDFDDVRKQVPGIMDVFTDEELPFVAGNLSIADAALEIILARLKKSGRQRYRVNPKTLRNLLTKVSLI